MVGEGVEPNLFTVLFIRAVCPFQEYLIQNKVNWWHGRGRGRAKFVYRPLYQSSLSLPRISLVKKTATMMVQYFITPKISQVHLHACTHLQRKVTHPFPLNKPQNVLFLGGKFEMMMKW